MGKTQKPENEVGPAIRELAASFGIPPTELRLKLYKLLENSHKNYGKSTIQGFLYGKTLPLSSKEAVDFFSKAIENALNRHRSKYIKVKTIRRTVLDEAEEIGVLDESYSKPNLIEDDYIKIRKELVKRVVLQIYNFADDSEKRNAELANAILSRLEKQPSDIIHIMYKNWDACTSLTEADIKFWGDILHLSIKKREEYFQKWTQQAGEIPLEETFEATTSNAFKQWLVMRDHNYADTLRKSKKNPPKAPEKARKQITDEQVKSLGAVLKYLKNREIRQYPLIPSNEINLLLLFKYFLSDGQRKTVQEELLKLKEQ